MSEKLYEDITKPDIYFTTINVASKKLLNHNYEQHLKFLPQQRSFL